jgi:5-methylthioadenosine/S-adenosylhomocysteine deaminase
MFPVSAQERQFMHFDIFIKDCKLLLHKDDWQFIDHGCLGICGNRIAHVGLLTDLETYSCEKEINGSGLCAMPGLINGHAHNGMTLFRGLADDLPLMTWLTDHIFPAEARFVNEEMVYWCTQLACAELLLSGTTTVADAYYCMDGACQAYDKSGIRAVAGHGIIDFPAPGVPDPALKIKIVDQFIKKWHHHPRITPAVFAHSPYTCSSKTIQQAHHLAKKHNVPFFIHLAETQDEASMLPIKGLSPTAYLESLAVLDQQTILVHGVWLSEADIDLIAQHHCTVITCPRSNMQLGSGIAPVDMLLQKNIPVGLGTDSAASNNRLDLFAEMETCAKLAKVHDLNPVHGTARQILDMGTHMGADSLNLKNVGLLEKDQLADIILLDTSPANLTPMYSPALLVYSGCGGHVQTVIVDGKIVMANRTLLTIDINKTMEQVQKLARKMQESRP